MKSTKDYKRIVNNKIKVFGDTDFNKRVIRINKKKSIATGKQKKSPELLDTIYHEETHARHPNMHEKTVRKVTQAMLPSLSKAQKQKYYAKYS